MRRIIICTLIAFLYISTASAETIETRAGKVIKGDVIEITDEYIKVQAKEQVWKIPWNQLTRKTRELVENLVINTSNADSSQGDSRTDEYMRRGEEQFQIQNYEQAMQNFEKAVEVNPQLDYAYQMLATCSANLKQYDHALSYAKKALEINPQNGQIQVDLGYYYQTLKQYQESVKSFQAGIQSLSETSQRYMAYKGLGDSYRFLKDSENALAAYKKAADFEPNDGELLLTIAKGLTFSKKYEEALGYAERAQKIQPGNPNIHIVRGGLLTSLRRFDEAERNYQQALYLFQESGNTEGVNQANKALTALEQMQQESK